jgi:peptidyl-prolyl cis-trans isomerase SurA
MFMMKKFFSFLLIAILFTVAAIAQPQKVSADKIVAVVGNKIILKSDVDNSIIDMQRQGMEIPANGRCLVLEQTMGIKALVLQAEKDSIPINDEEIETTIDNRIRYFISQYGSKEELERIAGKTVYQLKEDFKEGIRDQKLAEAMRNKIVDEVRITPKEVKEYFDKIPKDSLPLYESELQIGQIVVYPKASREAEEYALEQLRNYKEQIDTKKKDFCTVATLYSEDPGSKDNCGKYDVNRNSKEMDGAWLSKAFSLKEGQISNPFKTRFGYHIIQMVSRAGDDAVVRHILKVPQVTQTEINAGAEKMDSVRSKLIAGTISFGEAVAKFSDEESAKYYGGMIQGPGGSYLTIDQLDKDMIPVLKDLKVGQYSQPVAYTDERGRKGVRIVYLVSKSEPHRENLKDDYNKIAQRALEEKKNDALEIWFSKHIPTYHLMIDDEFKTCGEMQKWFNAMNTTKITTPHSH